MVSRASTGHTSAGIIHKTQAAQLTHRFVQEPDVVVLRHLLAVASSPHARWRGDGAPASHGDEYLQPRGCPAGIHRLPGAGSKFVGTSNGQRRGGLFYRPALILSTTARASVHPTMRRRLAMMRFARVLPREVQSFTRRRAPEEPEAIMFVSNDTSAGLNYFRNFRSIRD